ncbi:glutathione peroxidase [Dietzia sp. HMSC21D01]|mgnify:FL=1|uniref:Glutathione peroxidase n=1 Tax=Dietzia cinnamea TaxID=321318 RepID=A0AAW5Q5Z5_9ACTN|nr:MULTISPECIES: glutathione peroxidase [Dietzia]KZO58460.1 glutathione peroxidase [Dietzia maris]AVM63924.1 glutathione peroxidase [Dietzia sp. oral taxon 368]MBM7231516.1 glutathione peroxidase [Dietzia cinnamea]MCT1863236.1 glutathione peroxidase [Dietzia cinnamea]MCT1885052.1 glutathione peroxidase [Dietzia cinnamea]
MPDDQTTLADFEASLLDGSEKDLSDYLGQVVLVVNTASKCGFTPQYKGLQALFEEFRDRGFVVLGFPCDQFAHQEPGTDEEIGAFCERNFGVEFPLFSKIEVNGSGAHPLYDWLKSEKSGVLGGRIKWNFTKFLVGRTGRVIDRFGPARKPEDLRDAVADALRG